MGSHGTDDPRSTDTSEETQIADRTEVAGRTEVAAEFDPRVGQCSVCRSAKVKRSAKGSVFWRCGLADVDGRFRRYPPLPVGDCSGYQEGRPHES